MTRILVPLAVVLVGIVVITGASGQIPELGPSSTARTVVVVPTEVRSPEVHKIVPRPIVLPNIASQVRRLSRADRTVAVRQLAASSRVLRFWSGKHQWLLAKRHLKCSEVPWQRTCTVARASQKLHLALAAEAQQKIDHEIPLINDWKTAVRWVQRIYPGTESWMLYISDREGGWGPWVWYGGSHWSGYHVGDDFLGMDTVGGWMQFRYSTFAPYWRGAEKDLRSRGYIIPSIPMPAAGGPTEYAAWLSPLAQALTAGYMRYYGKDGCHWCL